MAFKKPTINKVKTTMESLQIYLRAERKFGKTTLFRDLILEKFGDPNYGMLVKIGNEDGTSLLDELNQTDVQSFQEFLELINWVIKEKNKEHNIKIIGIDVVDELIPLVEEYVVKLSRKEKTELIRIEVKYLLKQGLSQRQIAKKLSMSVGAINKYVKLIKSEQE